MRPGHEMDAVTNDQTPIRIPTSKLARASLWLGLLGLAGGLFGGLFFPYNPLILAYYFLTPLAIVFGFAARWRIRRAPFRQRGLFAANGGIALGFLGFFPVMLLPFV